MCWRKKKVEADCVGVVGEAGEKLESPYVDSYEVLRGLRRVVGSWIGEVELVTERNGKEMNLLTSIPTI